MMRNGGGGLSLSLFLPQPTFAYLPNPCLFRLPKRLSSFKTLCISNSDTPDDFHLISSTECSDGSVVFRFGNASEIEIESVKESTVTLTHVTTSIIHSPQHLAQLLDTYSNSDVDVVKTTSECSASIIDDVVKEEYSTGNYGKSDLSEQVSHDNSEGEIVSQLPTSNTNIQVMHFSPASKDHDVDSVTNEDGDVLQVMPESTPLTNDGIGSSKMLDDTVPSSTWEEITDGDMQSSKIAEVLISSGVELHSFGTMKREEISAIGATELFLSSGAASLPHPSKALAGGDDAYFVNCQNWLGIADGVGQWSLEGTNAGLYARELMENCKRIVSDSNSIPVTDTVEVIRRSAVETLCTGLATVLVAYFDNQALHVANIGDSGFIVIRNGTVFKRSSPMVHEFNFPLRIERGDNPSELIEGYRIDLDEGDVIITATDGLFDNLYEQEIALFVSRSLQDGLKPQEIAKLLATRAQEVGRSASARSPFADAAQAAGCVGYTGGKLDDVTVIVSLVQERFTSHLNGLDTENLVKSLLDAIRIRICSIHISKAVSNSCSIKDLFS